MRKNYAWTLLTIASLTVIAWGLIASTSDMTAIELENIGSMPRSVSPSPSKETTLVKARPDIDRSEGYLGSESCKKCHEDYHQSWHTSYHRTMTQPITPATAPAAINNTSVTVEGLTYLFTRRNEDFFVELNDPIAHGKRMTRRLVLMTGSHHMHVFWYESGFDKTPAQLPILFLIDQQRWIPRRSAFLRTPNSDKGHELGRWNETCCQCHATHPRTRPEPDHTTWDTRVSDFGITCEACHGPGEAHVAFHQLAFNSPKPDSDPIVNPKDLPSRTRSDMCGQCHGILMVNITNAEDQEEFFTHGRRFRPGNRLDESYFLQVVRGSEKHWESETFSIFNEVPGRFHGHFWPDGEVRVSGRDYTGMIESKCFQQGELSCMSCHTMHQQDVTLQTQWKNDQLLPGMESDAACLQCHPKYKQLGTEHTHHAIDSEGSRCMNCHMPHTVYGILKTIRSHTISNPSVATTIETGRPNACNLCHLDHTLEQTAIHLSKWYGHNKPELAIEEKTTAASVLYLLGGDAAQRALQVAAFQWAPAQEASGTDWMQLYLLVGMDDSYDAVRLISERAYKSLPSATPLTYDALDSPQKREMAIGTAYQKILQTPLTPNAALLIDPQGTLDQSRFEALYNRRNHRAVYLQE